MAVGEVRELSKQFDPVIATLITAPTTRNRVVVSTCIGTGYASIFGDDWWVESGGLRNGLLLENLRWRNLHQSIGQAIFSYIAGSSVTVTLSPNLPWSSVIQNPVPARAIPFGSHLNLLGDP